VIFIVRLISKSNKIVGALTDRTKRIILPILFLIGHIESGHNPQAIGDNGKAIGHLQIHEACVQDVNRHFKTDYCHTDMDIPELAIEVFYKYIAIGEHLFIKKHGRFPEEKDIVLFWNHGIYYQPKKSKYYEKYKQVKKRFKEKTTKDIRFPQR